MIRLPPLDEATVVRVTREGGLAYLPGLARPRSFQLGDCSDELRRQIGDALQSAVPHAGQPGATVSGGDQRFYRVEVLVQGAGVQEISVSFEVPEADAPDALVHLWKDAGTP
ncbi:protealysin inhibitor emfourin [Variovorax sp. W6]|uniref:protealysin inhibitor emfourin n=1 Tax=Variovorax sp. W6 TaxID=3093895 RepID=UPI003D80927B